MPEGDSIFRAARTLHRALAGKIVTRFESVLPALTRVDEDAPLAERTVDEVSAAGKHLLMRFSGDLVLRTAGLPCRECGTLITRRAQGTDARLTYWCPRCQPDPE